MRSQTAYRRVDNEHNDHQELSDRAKHIHELSEAYKLGYQDGRRDEKHRPGDKHIRLLMSYSS
jgi:hypothetical protein